MRVGAFIVAVQSRGRNMARKDKPATAEESSQFENFDLLRSIRVSLRGLLILALFAAIYFARDFLLPVVVAFLLALTLSPIVRFFQKHGVSPGVSALVLVVAMVAVSSAGTLLLSGPLSQWVETAPKIGQQLKQKLSSFRGPIEALIQASEQVDTMTEGGSSSIQKVVIQQPGILSRATDNLVSGFATAAITFVLLLFLLASGTMFYEKMVSIMPTMTDKKRALRIAYDVEQDVSHYLSTITLINVGFGVAVAAAMTLTGMPNPLLWGVAAMLLNFIPYVGAVAGVIMVTIVSVVTFDSLGYAALPPAIYVALAIVEGQFLTPVILGRRLELNPVAIFIVVAMWSWLWGIVGAIIAVPLLVAVKVLCDHFDGLASFGEFLSKRPVTIASEEPAADTKIMP